MVIFGRVSPTRVSESGEALASEYSDNLVGFGSAPEGLENNEVVYELLADMGWIRGERAATTSMMTSERQWKYS